MFVERQTEKERVGGRGGGGGGSGIGSNLQLITSHGFTLNMQYYILIAPKDSGLASESAIPN